MTRAGECLGPYRLVEKLGQGGNGEVWRATGPDSDVAIKVLKRNPPQDAIPRFVREIEALKRLREIAGILPLLDADEAAGRWFAMPIAMTLTARLGEDASLQEVCNVMSGVAEVLSQIHAKQISHRDIKPGNLYWHDGRACLGDFGLVEFPDAEPITSSGHKLGPVNYIAPEMLNDAKSAVGTPADVYSLGKTIWVLATGQKYPLPGVHDPTFPGAKIGSFDRDKRRSGLLDELLRRMSQLEPSRRPSAEEVARELAILAREESASVSQDRTAVLADLRAALVPHFTRMQLDAHRTNLRETVTSKIEQVIERVAQDVRRESGLETQFWSVPQIWGFQQYMGSASVTHEGDIGYAVEAPTGSFRYWRLSFGLRWQLLSNDLLVLTVGYYFDQMLNGRERNTSGGPRGWKKSESALNGSASCDELANKLIADFEETVPQGLKTFARLVEDASNG